MTNLEELWLGKFILIQNCNNGKPWWQFLTSLYTTFVCIINTIEGDNKITSIPTEIGLMKNIEVLSLCKFTLTHHCNNNRL